MADEAEDTTGPVIGVVGPCNAGKSTLVRALAEHGFTARHIAQEHSFAPSMWQLIGHARILIFLDVTYPVAQKRRRLDWLPADWAEEQRRLAHAREHADLYLHTDELDISTVRERVLAFLSTRVHQRP